MKSARWGCLRHLQILRIHCQLSSRPLGPCQRIPDDRPELRTEVRGQRRSKPAASVDGNSRQGTLSKPWLLYGLCFSVRCERSDGQPRLHRRADRWAALPDGLGRGPGFTLCRPHSRIRTRYVRRRTANTTVGPVLDLTSAVHVSAMSDLDNHDRCYFVVINRIHYAVVAVPQAVILLAG